MLNKQLLHINIAYTYTVTCVFYVRIKYRNLCMIDVATLCTCCMHLSCGYAIQFY